MAWLQARNLSTDGGYGYFVNRTAHIAVAQGRRPIQWNEVWDHFGTALPKEAIVHAWNDRSAMARATAAGYAALNSQGWYLDHLATSWESMYTNVSSDRGLCISSFVRPMVTQMYLHVTHRCECTEHGAEAGFAWAGSAAGRRHFQVIAGARWAG
jgi:hypothetical protein